MTSRKSRPFVSVHEGEQFPADEGKTFEGKLTMTNQCYRCQELSKEVDEVLSEMVLLTTEQLDAFQKGDVATFTKLDKDLELALGKKERRFGAFREHQTTHRVN
jgi:hypothetical protein